MQFSSCVYVVCVCHVTHDVISVCVMIRISIEVKGSPSLSCSESREMEMVCVCVCVRGISAVLTLNALRMRF